VTVAAGRNWQQQQCQGNAKEKRACALALVFRLPVVEQSMDQHSMPPPRHFLLYFTIHLLSFPSPNSPFLAQYYSFSLKSGLVFEYKDNVGSVGLLVSRIRSWKPNRPKHKLLYPIFLPLGFLSCLYSYEFLYFNFPTLLNY
jgi:hypothetical protein